MIIIVIIIVITFMQGIYNYEPETNRVSRVYCVAAVLYLQVVLCVMLLHMLNVFCNFTLSTFRSIYYYYCCRYHYY